MRSRLVLVSTSSFGGAGRRPRARLEAAGLEVRLNPHGRTLTRAETIELLDGAWGVVAGTETLDGEVLERAGDLRVISRCGGGLDSVDLAAAAARGIEVFSTPEAPVAAVAELTLAGILALQRRLRVADRRVREGSWSKPMGRLLAGRSVGLVGFGRVGRALAGLLAPFAVRLLATDPAPDLEAGRRHGVTWMELDELLTAADIVSLHAPRTPDDPPLLDRARLARMRPDALLVNTARGGLVDETALVERLERGELAGAYLDVFAREPYRGPLVKLPNVLLTPHVGSYTSETRLAMELEAVENLLLFSRRTETA